MFAAGAHLFASGPAASSLRDEILTITSFTGHPSLSLRASFVEVSEARSDCSTKARSGGPGTAMERAFAVSTERLPGF
jgi:hypothetical protein